MFNTVFIQPLANGLILFYKILGENMGIAIIGFSLFLRFLLNPLTKPYMESMRKMKDYSGQLEKIKRKYKDDKMKSAQAQSEFYKQKGINPGAGCLPYLLQIVILIAFFNVFTKTLTPGVNPAESFNNLLYQPLKFSEGEIINTKFLYFDITTPDVIKFPGLPFPLPGPMLILAAAIQMVTSSAMTKSTKVEEKMAKKTTSEVDNIQVSMQKSMMYTFPLLTLVFGMQFSSGLTLYWLLFSVFQLFQQYSFSQMKSWFSNLDLVKSVLRKN